MSKTLKTSKVNYFDFKPGTKVIVIERHSTYDGEQLTLPYSECVAFNDHRISSGVLTDGKIHYMYDFELED